MRQIARLIGLGYVGVIALVVALQLLGVTRFMAPVNVIPLPQRPPVVVNLIYSSEQQEWMLAAAQQFAATEPSIRNRPIQLVLRSQPSQSIIDGIVSGSSQPTAIIPAGSTQLATLSRDWARQHGGSPLVATNGANQPQPIALSPLVLAGWKERMDLLFPSGNQDVWQRLHDALVKTDWSDPALGGKQEWGPVKLGHASPQTANSGIETLVLLAYAYQHKAQGLNLGEINDAGFQSWLKEIEQGVPDTPNSTDALFDAFLLKGPSAYDVVVVYESQAIRGITQARQSLRVIYPPATTWSDHPFAVLEASWNTPEQQEAAQLFRDFLLSEPAQRLALRYGFRPANAAVSLTANIPDNPFPAAASAGVQQTAPGSVAAPPPELVDALVDLWQQTRR